MTTFAALEHCKDAYAASTPGLWKEGATSHDTVCIQPGKSDQPYRIGSFHHADDASFIDAAHMHMPQLIALIESLDVAAIRACVSHLRQLGEFATAANLETALGGFATIDKPADEPSTQAQ